MANYSLKVNYASIKQKFDNELIFHPAIQEKAKQIVDNVFYRAHQALMKDFFEHEITQELKTGNDASNSSGTLNGYGNLFTFLGFMVGEDPTFELEELLQRINIQKTTSRNGFIYFRVNNIPTQSQIAKASKMTWGNRSWALAVESGRFDGDALLSHFVFKSWDKARSLEGFQVKGYEYSDETFKPRKYMTEILENFANRINNSRSKFLA